jgi:hypothetical protein
MPELTQAEIRNVSLGLPKNYVPPASATPPSHVSPISSPTPPAAAQPSQSSSSGSGSSGDRTRAPQNPDIENIKDLPDVKVTTDSSGTTTYSQYGYTLAEVSKSGNVNVIRPGDIERQQAKIQAAKNPDISSLNPALLSQKGDILYYQGKPLFQGVQQFGSTAEGKATITFMKNGQQFTYIGGELSTIGKGANFVDVLRNYAVVAGQRLTPQEIQGEKGLFYTEQQAKQIKASMGTEVPYFTQTSTPSSNLGESLFFSGTSGNQLEVNIGGQGTSTSEGTEVQGGKWYKWSELPERYKMELGSGAGTSASILPKEWTYKTDTSGNIVIDYQGPSTISMTPPNKLFTRGSYLPSQGSDAYNQLISNARQKNAIYSIMPEFAKSMKGNKPYQFASGTMLGSMPTMEEANYQANLRAGVKYLSATKAPEITIESIPQKFTEFWGQGGFKPLQDISYTVSAAPISILESVKGNVEYGAEGISSMVGHPENIPGGLYKVGVGTIGATATGVSVILYPEAALVSGLGFAGWNALTGGDIRQGWVEGVSLAGPMKAVEAGMKSLVIGKDIVVGERTISVLGKETKATISILKDVSLYEKLGQSVAGQAIRSGIEFGIALPIAEASYNPSGATIENVISSGITGFEMGAGFSLGGALIGKAIRPSTSISLRPSTSISLRPSATSPGIPTVSPTIPGGIEINPAAPIPSAISSSGLLGKPNLKVVSSALYGLGETANLGFPGESNALFAKYIIDTENMLRGTKYQMLSVSGENPEYLMNRRGQIEYSILDTAGKPIELGQTPYSETIMANKKFAVARFATPTKTIEVISFEQKGGEAQLPEGKMFDFAKNLKQEQGFFAVKQVHETFGEASINTLAKYKGELSDAVKNPARFVDATILSRKVSEAAPAESRYQINLAEQARIQVQGNKQVTPKNLFDISPLGGEYVETSVPELTAIKEKGIRYSVGSKGAQLKIYAKIRPMAATDIAQQALKEGAKAKPEFELTSKYKPAGVDYSSSMEDIYKNIIKPNKGSSSSLIAKNYISDIRPVTESGQVMEMVKTDTSELQKNVALSKAVMEHERSKTISAQKMELARTIEMKPTYDIAQYDKIYGSTAEAQYPKALSLKMPTMQEQISIQEQPQVMKPMELPVSMTKNLSYQKTASLNKSISINKPVTIQPSIQVMEQPQIQKQASMQKVIQDQAITQPAIQITEPVIPQQPRPYIPSARMPRGGGGNKFEIRLPSLPKSDEGNRKRKRPVIQIKAKPMKRPTGARTMLPDLFSASISLARYGKATAPNLKKNPSLWGKIGALGAFPTVELMKSGGIKKNGTVNVLRMRSWGSTKKGR